MIVNLYLQDRMYETIYKLPHYLEMEGINPAMREFSIDIINGAGTRKIKGTSSTKTSLRRPLVKRATRRALRYKGRRRSRVNHR